MKNLVTLTLIGALAASAPAFADSVSEDHSDVKADIGAINKDNAALRKDQDKLAHDRAIKADAKANDENGKQAAASVDIAADKSAIAEKQAEKNTDRKILEHHEKELNKDKAAEGDLAPASGYNH